MAGSDPKIRLLSGQTERGRWLTRKEADRLIAAAAPHLKALIRFALASSRRAREIAGLEWARVDFPVKRSPHRIAARN